MNMYNITKITDSQITASNAVFPTDWQRVRSLILNGHNGLKKMMKNKDNENLEMSFVRDKVYGDYDRVYTSGISPVNLECSLRCGIWGDTAVDIDQSCAQQRAMISCIESDDNLIAPRETYNALYHYVENKDSERQRVADLFFNGNVKKAKNMYQALTFGGSIANALKKNGNTQTYKGDAQLNNYVNNLKLFSMQVKESNPKIAELVRKQCDKQNKKDIKTFLAKNKDKNEEDARTEGIGVKCVNRSLLALWGRNKEQHITEEAVKYLIDNDIIKGRRFAPCHDGIMLYKPDIENVDDVIESMNNHVKTTLGFDVVFEVHDMEEQHNTFMKSLSKTEDEFEWNEDDRRKFNPALFKKISTHYEQTKYWELHFAYCIDQRKTAMLLSKEVFLNDGSTETERCLQWFGDKELTSAFGNFDDAEVLDIYGNPKKFVNVWLSDPNRRTYNYVDVIPYAGPYEPTRGCTDDVFNAFVGYPKYIWGDDTKYSDTEMRDALQPFFTMVMHLIGCQGYDKLGRFSPDQISDEDYMKFDTLMHLIGHRIMHPDEEKLPYAILIKSIQGCGKNTLSDVCARIVGLSQYKCSSNIEDFCGTHAEGMCGKLFAVMNEAEIKNTGKHKNAVKELISESKGTCNAKYQRPFEYAVRALILVFSNECCPINLDQTGKDRRWFVYQANDFCAKRWGQSVWKKLHTHFASMKFLRCLKQYFASLDYKTFDFKNAKRCNNKTEAYKKLACYFYPSELLFFQNYIETKQFDPVINEQPFYKNWNNSVTIKAKDFFESANEYYKQTNNETALSKKYVSFNNSIEKHNMPITKTKESSGSRSPQWTFTPKDIYAWLIENAYVDSEQITDDLRDALDGEQVEEEINIDDLGFNF